MGRNRCEFCDSSDGRDCPCYERQRCCRWCGEPDCDEHRCDNCHKPCQPCACGGCEFCCAYAMDYCPIRDAAPPEPDEDEPTPNKQTRRGNES